MSAENTEGEDKNIWQDLLAKSTSAGWNTAKTATSNLIVVGDRQNGKSSVLNKFSDRVTDEKVASEFILDYSYINVKNKFNLDKDEVVSRMSLWQLDDENHSDLLVQLLKPQELDTAAYVITIDLSKPWGALESLTKWLEVLKATNAKIFGQLAEEEQAALKLKISKAVQGYVDPGVSAATAAAAAVEEEKKEGEVAPAEGEAPAEAAEGEPAPAEEDAVPAEAEVDPAIPACNLGVPIVIVGTKADYFSRVLAKTGADEKFEFVAQRVRKIALEYGAATVFTSAFGEGANISQLQDYICHRVLGLPNKTAAKVIASAEDIAIFAPSGFDSLELINSGSTAKAGWTDETKLSEIFENSEKKKQDEGEEVVRALDNDEFFTFLRAQMDKSDKGGTFTPVTPTKTEAGDKKKNQNVKNFFKSLLNSGEKKKAAE